MGLGLEQFLNHNKDGGGRKFLDKWKDDKSIVVWISSTADPAYASWNHPFMYMDEFEDKDTGKQRDYLKFVRFVSPDPETIHMSQHFREDDSDRLKLPPIKDPFLLLREYLRLECDLPLEAVIFRWRNPKNKEVIEWTRGRISGLVKKGQNDWNHSLDTKLDYLFVVIDNSSPEAGPQITRETKLLGERMKEVITREMESNGENGNPMTNPYAFRWKYNKSAAPMDKYEAYRFNKAELTDAVRDAITNRDYPDPEIDTRPRAGDKAKIRAAMEDAAVVDLPWDRFFVDAWDDGDSGEKSQKPKSKPERTPDVKTAPASAPSEGSGPKRRRKKNKPKPPPEPELIQCDGDDDKPCDFMMPITATKCEKCGMEYEVMDEPNPSTSSGTTTTTEDEKCWSCSSTDVSGGHCNECGLDVGDDIPM